MCLSCCIALDSVRACLHKDDEHQPDIPVLRRPTVHTLYCCHSFTQCDLQCSSICKEFHRAHDQCLTMLHSEGVNHYLVCHMPATPGFLLTSGLASVSEYSTLRDKPESAWYRAKPNAVEDSHRRSAGLWLERERERHRSMPHTKTPLDSRP